MYFGRYTGTNTKSYAAILNTTADLSQNLAPDTLYKGYFCPNPARRLRAYYEPDTADAVTGESGFVSYVNTFVAEGIGTYHDIGLLWGARLLSPTGIFKADNALTGNGGAIERHMIFMTDGDSRAFDNNLYAYGAPWFARQQTPTGTAPTNDTITAQINPRTKLLCTLIKNMNIKLWVISYGGGADLNTEDMLEDCRVARPVFRRRGRRRPAGALPADRVRDRRSEADELTTRALSTGRARCLGRLRRSRGRTAARR